MRDKAVDRSQAADHRGCRGSEPARVRNLVAAVHPQPGHVEPGRLQAGVDRGRAKHREWCETKLGATGAKLPLAVVATDVYTWKLLRRDQGLSKDETARAMLVLVTAVLDDRRS